MGSFSASVQTIKNLKNPELSVVVLSYQSENYIEVFCRQLIGEIEELNISYEIILVANYDQENDTTPVLANKLSEKFANVEHLALEKAGKMGWDMRMGLEQTTGKYIAVIDGDGQMPVSDIPVVYKIIKHNKFDLVKTYRALRKDGVYRKTLSRIYNLAFNMLYVPSVRFRDVNSKPKIFTRDCFDQLFLQSNDWFTDAEIMIQAIKQQQRVCEVGTVFYKNERRSSYVRIKTVFEFIYNLIYYKFSND